MSLRFLLDTNVLSEPTRQHPHPNVMARLQQHEGEIATSTTVWHELLFGCERLPNSQKRRFLERYLNEIVRSTIPILPYKESDRHNFTAIYCNCFCGVLDLILQPVIKEYVKNQSH